MFLNVSTKADISSTATYRLVNSWSQGPLSLEPGKSDLKLQANKTTNDTAALAFQFRTSDSSGSFNLCAAVESQTYCLDVYNAPKTVPHLTPFGYYSGQYWTVKPSDDGAVKLSNEWTGADRNLDLYDGSYEAYMSEGVEDYAGQYWMLEQVAEKVALPPNAPVIDDVSSTPVVNSGSRSSSTRLSTPALIGISLAGGILSAAIILAVSALLYRRRRRHTRQQRQAAFDAGASASQSRQHLLVPMTSSNSSRNNLPAELESPMDTAHQVHHRPNPLQYHPYDETAPYSLPGCSSGPVYELPAEDHPHHDFEDQITPAIASPPPSYTSFQQHRQYNPDEKDPTLFPYQQQQQQQQHSPSRNSTTSASDPTPSSTSAATTAAAAVANSPRPRPTARWEEVVSDGEIVFSTALLPLPRVALQHDYRRNRRQNWQDQQKGMPDREYQEDYIGRGWIGAEDGDVDGDDAILSGGTGEHAAASAHASDSVERGAEGGGAGAEAPEGGKLQPLNVEPEDALSSSLTSPPPTPGYSISIYEAYESGVYGQQQQQQQQQQQAVVHDQAGAEFPVTTRWTAAAAAVDVDDVDMSSLQGMKRDGRNG